ncbi:hypothetical protein [Xanthomonas arboricola]|nr:hypothetical protein [Xanthomonas arboricola]
MQVTHRALWLLAYCAWPWSQAMTRRSVIPPLPHAAAAALQ